MFCVDVLSRIVSHLTCIPPYHILGVDVNARNSDDRNVLDLLVEVPSERAHEITTLIYDITNDTYSQVGGPMRSLTVSEKRPDKSPYTCVEYPRRSESTSLLEASISPAPSEITQDEIFNDEFLRDARPVEIPSESGLPPAKPKRIALETMTRTAEPNAYEEHHVAGIDAVHTNTQQQANTGPEQRQTSSVYDIVPPPSRKPAGSVTSQTSRDSIPPFPPPTSAEAHEALRQLAGLNEMPLERAEVAAADKPEPIYLNTPPLQKKPTKPQRSKKAAVREKKEEEVKRQQTASTLSDFERLHMNMSPPPLTSEAYENVDIAMKQTDGAEEDRAESTASSSTDTYDNVNITNRPSYINTDDLYDNVNITNKPMASNASVKTGEDLLSFVEPAAGAEAVRSPSPRLEFDARRPSGVKQNRTSKSINNKPISPLPSTTATTASGSSTSSSRPGSTLNESYEWNKIDNIFASLLEANPEEQLEISQHSRQPASIGDWLAQLGLSYYEAPFVASGYDDIRFMGGDVLEEDDLREIGIQNIDHIRTILEAASSLLSPPRIGDAEFPVPRSVKEWLTEINLADYETKFLINSYDSMDRVRAIWEFELTTVIGIHFSGHRKRMIHSLGHRQQETREQVSWVSTCAQHYEITTLPTVQKPRETRCHQSSTSVISYRSENLYNSQKFAAAEAPKTPKPATNDDAYDLHNQLLKDVVTGIEKRRYSRSDSKSPPVSESTNSSHPSSPRSPTSPTTPKYQPSFSWIHKPEKLLYDSALYITQYLGSHPVMVVRGTQSTLDACKKLSGTSKMLQKIPTIQLAISVRGIDFMDAQSHAVISSYDIRNISYCAQDPSDLTIYAYITKDTATGKHYCHVFKAKDLTVGDEIVLTIGQAFELAYHQHRVLVEGNKDRKENDVSSSKHAVQNRLHSTSDNEAVSSPTSPPPMPKPFSQRKKVSKLSNIIHTL
eukprot:gene18059-19868_t